ncbi:hypothetical protein J421_2021 [Gemmatirosa kalamazoonensis]|uniref:BIG2 domain-containing protein n=1 Tax=Gemmatirosa kalamazoonensis TaxID=861299 RepID=W0RJG2_9BACT|nr:FG-GAP-like repeat-containing protein [Gemmatirosa kalamazoonensis]AHG89558.1 hypothetical protein J421_2021 [Gemmatirosa kalamazoonensis]
MLSARAASAVPALALVSLAACVDAPTTPAEAAAADRMRATPDGPHFATGVTGRDLQLVFEQPSTGDHAYWRVRNGAIASTGSYGVVPTSWSIVGVADGSNDGIDDIYWQHTPSNGLVAWRMDATDASSATLTLPSSAPSPWKVFATADFDHDGSADLVWRNTTTGDLVLWLMNGTAFGSSLYLANVPTAWQVATAGDLDGDGNADIVWQNTSTGARVAWRMTGTTHTSTVDLGVVPPGWTIAALGDYDDDGHADIFWQDPTAGTIVVWRMNGATYLGTVAPGSPPAPWLLKAVRRSGTGAATNVAFPTSITAAPGAVGRLTVGAFDGSGVVQAASSVTYQSTNAGVVTVDASGRVTMVAPGTASVLASVAGGAPTSVSVTVSAAPASAFQIDVQPVGTVPPALLAVAQQAVQRWQRVITAALPTRQLDLNVGDCDTGTPAVHQSTNGIVVFIATRAMDGLNNTLASAGPCMLRDLGSGGLPLAGTMTVDDADVAQITAAGGFGVDVLAHELGHVLGIGTLWTAGYTPAGNLLRSVNGDARFTGANASSATARVGLTPNAADGAQVETDGGHWRETVFRGELMTGWVGATPNPLSVVSVQSLRDLGYQVTETGADIVSPASVVGGASLAIREPRTRIGERVLRPRFVSGPNGRRPLGASGTRERQ